MEEIFSELANILQTVVPKKWYKVILYAEISENGYDISFYCFISGKKEALQCYNLERYGITERAVDGAFEKIYTVLKPFWQESEKTNKWTNCTFSLTHDGKFDLDLDYTDLMDNSYEYREQWKAKYIEEI